MNSTLSRAQAVATRRNNAERRKLPLFADQLPVDTAEQVLARRAIARQDAAEWRVRFDALTARHLSERIARIRALTSDAEFAEIEQEVARCGFGAEVGWGIAEGRLKRRAEPLTDDEHFVLALLWNQSSDVTADELHQRCGDGMSREVITRALFGLQDRGYAGGGVLRLCAVTGLDRAPWEATAAGRELNREAA